LNLKKEGEVVYNFASPPTSTPPGVGGEASGQGNFQKWLNYFFQD
jgi:hypothetical protein